MRSSPGTGLVPIYPSYRTNKTLERIATGGTIAMRSSSIPATYSLSAAAGDESVSGDSSAQTIRAAQPSR